MPCRPDNTLATPGERPSSLIPLLDARPFTPPHPLVSILPPNESAFSRQKRKAAVALRYYHREIRARVPRHVQHTTDAASPFACRTALAAVTLLVVPVLFQSQ
eukprot:IDg1659t1